MRVVEFDEGYQCATAFMLEMYFNEVAKPKKRPIEKSGEALTKILSSHSVYLLLNDKDELTGFMSCYINDEYGMVDPYLVCEYQYIVPFHRGGKAVAYMTQALAELCVKLQLPIVNTTFVTSSSTNNMERLGATPLSKVSYLSLEEATKIYKKYTRRIDR